MDRDVLDSLTMGMLHVVQIWRSAFSKVTTSPLSPTPEGTMSEQLNLYMKILEESVSYMNVPMLSNTGPSEALTQAMARAHDIGAKLVQGKTTGTSMNDRIAYVLAPPEELEKRLDQFRQSVMIVHSLVQSMILRNFLERQTAFAQDQSQLIQRVNLDLIANMKRRDSRDGDQITQLGDEASHLSRDTSLQTDSGVASFTETIVTKTMDEGVRFNSDPSLVTGTITMIHGKTPKFVPVRIKYDTGSDANFIPLTLITHHGLEQHLDPVSSDNEESEVIFIGLNGKEYVVKHTITLNWCSSSMRRSRKSVFHVIDDMGYDLLLGNQFIIDNSIFTDTPRRVLPITFVRKPRDYSSRKTEAEEKVAREANALRKEQLLNEEDQAQWASAGRFAKAQTSMSSLLASSPPSISTLSLQLAQHAAADGSQAGPIFETDALTTSITEASHEASKSSPRGGNTTPQ